MRVHLLQFLDLHSGEIGLEGGRFHSYCRDTEGTLVTTKTILRSVMKQAAGRVVDWIAENCRGKWRIEPTFDEETALHQINVWFEDDTDALMFRLSLA